MNSYLAQKRDNTKFEISIWKKNSQADKNKIISYFIETLNDK